MKKGMRAGSLNNLVTLQEQITTEDEYGEEITSYQSELESREQSVSQGDWEFDSFILIENQNLDKSEPAITEVSGSTDGTLTENDGYEVTQNDDNDWGIKIDSESEETTTESQSITIKYNQKPYQNIWANIENLSGDRYFEAQAANSEVTGEILIRYRDDINEEMRVKFGSRIFDIESFYDPAEEREKIVLLVKEQK